MFRYLLYAPDIAKKALPGQFIIIRLDETGERIPITISDADQTRGTLTLYVQGIGKTTMAPLLGFFELRGDRLPAWGHQTESFHIKHIGGVV